MMNATNFKLRPATKRSTLSTAPPRCLSAKSKVIWNSILSEFSLSTENLALLQLGLENLDLANNARELLRTQGLVTSEGKRNPASDAVKLHDGMFLRALRQLGLDVINKGAK